jgi:hypothetical protein
MAHSGQRSPEEISRLFDIVGRESSTIRQLSGCVEQLLEVELAKESLKTLTPADVTAALQYQRTIPGGQS